MEQEELKRIYRSEDDRIIAGVCGGLGDYFNIDPVIVRIVMIAACFTGGSGLIIYLLSWFLIPRQPFDLK
ncbi:PspC domain-containing protein [bacterium]|nr:PspC domain-containing protein [bacterium]